MNMRILGAAMLVVLFSFKAYAGPGCCDKKTAEQQNECKKPCNKNGKTTGSEPKKQTAGSRGCKHRPIL